MDLLKKFFGFIIFTLLFLSPGFAGNTSATWTKPQYISTYIPNSKYSAMMKEAFWRWSKATDDRFVFYYKNSPDNVNLNVYFVDNIGERHDNNNAVGLQQEKYLTNGIKLHSDIYIAEFANNGKKLSDDQVFTTMIHEIGHSLGLKHSSDPNSIMYPINNVKQEITDDDVLDLLDLYGY